MNSPASSSRQGSYAIETSCVYHPYEQAEYLCETCGRKFCAMCWVKQRKIEPTHVKINLKEKALVMMDELNAVPLKNISKQEESIVKINSSLMNIVKTFNMGVEQTMKVFEKSYSPVQKLEELREYAKTLYSQQRYMELYQYLKDAIKQKNEIIVKENSFQKHIHFWQLGEQLCNIKDNFVREFEKLINEVKDLEGKTKNEEEKKFNDKQEEQKSEHKPVFVQEYQEEQILKAKGKDEDDIITYLQEANISQYKVIDARYLDIVGNRTAQVIADIVSKNQNISAFLIGGDYISDIGAEIIANLVSSHSNISTFYLGGGKITDAGAELIANAVKKTNHIVAFGLGSKQISDVGTEKIADAVKNNHRITSFYIGSFKALDKGISALAQAIKGNDKLQAVYFYGYITGNGLKVLSEVLDSHPSIQSFNIYLESITEEELEECLSKMEKIGKRLKIRLASSDSTTRKVCESVFKKKAANFKELEFVKYIWGTFLEEPILGHAL